MNFKVTVFLLVLLYTLSANAQKKGFQNITPKQKSPDLVKELKIGQTVPDVNMAKIVHVDGTIKAGHLSDFKAQLVILDFLYTTCSSCIAGLVKKEQLQQKFGDQIKIMAVVGGEKYAPGMLKRENASFVRAFLMNKKSFLAKQHVKIPWVVENEKLNEYFPHQFVSHLVWIYKGQVIAITEQDVVTESNIQLILDGKTNDWPVKNDFLPKIDVNTALIKQEEKFEKNSFNRYAAIFGMYQDGVSTKFGFSRDTISHTRRDYIINLPVLSIYFTKWKEATGVSRNINPSSTILEVGDLTKYVKQEDSEESSYAKRKNTFVCYEAMTVDTGQSEKEVARKVISDLDYLLRLHGRYERRKIKCLVMYRIDSLDKIKYQGDDLEGRSNLVVPNIELVNKSLGLLVWKMNRFYGNPPVFDETGYTSNISLKFSLKSWQDISAIKAALNNYGIGLREEQREIEVFVLTDLLSKSE